MRNRAPAFETLLKRATARLRDAGVADPQRDARWLLREAASLSPAGLAAALDRTAPREAAARFESMVARRAAREPVSHILGRREFFGHRFLVDARALDPRPESETLVEAALEALAPEQEARVLDLGVGSGCLLLSVLAARPRASGLGVDASAEALALAAENLAALDVERAVADPVAPPLGPRTRLVEGDWLSGIGETFDLVLCNPPYIAEAEWATLEPEPWLFEPKGALTPGADGLSVYRRLAPGIGAVLRHEAAALFEVGRGQAQDVAALMAEAGLETQVRRDLGGAPRVVEARRRRHASTD